ncbi:hypothetical protein ACH5RR_022212 [Cinchona calisaya]|uniref:Cyclase n=1 Tax=Cinchona calisaya TaxID=153742 RepID=A0ABD2ZAJ8_9GENT
MMKQVIAFSWWAIILFAAVVADATYVFPEDLKDDCIIDITHTYKNVMPSFDSPAGAKDIINERIGDITVTSTITMGAHLGTHVDTPSHIFKDLRGKVTVDNIKLSTLIGPVLVVQIPNEPSITEAVLRSLNIPRGVKRVIFKTRNTERKLMDQLAFEADYTAFTADGAKYLVDNTDIKFVGIDYMSIAKKEEICPVHQILLDQNRGIIPVENLKLDGVEPGSYTINCLPLRILAEAAPVRYDWQAQGIDSTFASICV